MCRNNKHKRKPTRIRSGFAHSSCTNELGKTSRSLNIEVSSYFQLGWGRRFPGTALTDAPVRRRPVLGAGNFTTEGLGYCTWFFLSSFRWGHVKMKCEKKEKKHNKKTARLWLDETAMERGRNHEGVGLVLLINAK